MIKKSIFSLLSIILMVVLSTSHAFAHVGVIPKEVGVGSFQTFTVGVPNEREVPTTQVRLVLPEGLEHVTPNVKPGWEIDVVREEAESMEEEGHPEGRVIEIIWSGGSIPQGQRDDFNFSAKVPTEESTLTWKAYQTYEGGNVVAWELGPDEEQPTDKEGNSDFSTVGPASQTEVVNDLATSEENETGQNQTAELTSSSLPMIISVIALVLAVAALGLQFQKRK